MKALLVRGPKSTLWGARCGLCPRTVKAGEAVVYHDNPNDSYQEARLVFHTSCMQALLDRAPAGLSVAAAAAEADRVRAAVHATGRLYPELEPDDDDLVGAR